MFIVPAAVTFDNQFPVTHRHRLAGTVDIDGVPGKKLVGVFLRSSMVLVAAKFSDPITGAFEFKWMPEYPMQSLLVVGLDEEGGQDYNAAPADFISQVTGG
jgi:hypothetical protein